MVSHRAPDGLVASSSYDACGRLTARSYANLGEWQDPGPESYTYDALGRLTSAVNAGGSVARTYDTLGNMLTETVASAQLPGAPKTTTSTYDGYGRRNSIAYPGGAVFDLTRDGLGRLTKIEYGIYPYAEFSWQGARPAGRSFPLNSTETEIAYGPRGRRVSQITHSDDSKAAFDTRQYVWDKAGNLLERTVTMGGSPIETEFSYDALNRMTAAGAESWTLDDAGNRTGGDYALDGAAGDMNRYTASPGHTEHRYDASGALSATDNADWLFYDALGRPVEAFYGIDLSASAEISLDPAGPDAIELPLGYADWDFNSGDGTLTETSVYAARMLVGTEFMRVVTSIRYKSAHDPDDPDGDTNEEFSTEDYRSKFYAEFILDADVSDPSNPPDCPFLAVAITPAELLLVEYDGGETRELARTDFVSEEDVWHTLSAVTADGRAIVSCVPDTAGAAAARLDADFSVGAAAGGVDGAVGVGVGANAAYTFEDLGSRADLGEYTAHYRWEYDALGRKSAEMRAPYGGAKTWTIFAYDGLRQLQAFDVVSQEPPDTDPTALYLYGPGGLDDLVGMMLECDETPGLNQAAETFFAHTDAQNSVVALVRPNGAIAERYAYAPFGEPAIYAPDGTTERTASLYNNTRLYTGRPWNADLGLYDCRMRHYDPVLGRFISPDPIGAYGDWNNLGNPYSYVGNNPGAFTDPLGLQTSDEDINRLLDRGTVHPGDPFLMSVGKGDNPVANATRPIGRAHPAAAV